MEFSSTSSDDEALVADLRRAHERERRDESGIVTVRPPHGSSRPTEVTIGGGTTIEARKGTIFIPVRDRYVHVLDAKRRPEFFFGDARLRPAQRPKLDPHRVLLLRTSPGLPATRWLETSLEAARDTDFFVFKEVTPASAPRPEPHSRSAPSAASAPPTAHPARASTTVPVHSPRLSMHGLLRGSQRFATLTPPRPVLPLQGGQWERLPSLPEWAHGEEALALDPCDGSVLRYNGLSKQVRTTSRASSGRGWMESVCPTPQTMPTQQALGITSLYHSYSNVTAVNSCGRALIGSTCATLLLCPPAEPCGLLAPSPPCSLASSRAHAPYHSWCSCSYANGHAPWLGLASNGAVFEATADLHVGRWVERRVRHFARTPVTAVCALALSHCAPPRAIVAGMRNGTMQLIPLGEKEKAGEFDTAVRHQGACVQTMEALVTRPFEVVSVASNGEAKVWDVRYLAPSKPPVRELNTVSRFAEQFGAKATFCDAVVAIASKGRGLVCIDALQGGSVHVEDVSVGSADFAVLLGRDGPDFEVYLVEEQCTRRARLLCLE